MAKLILTLDGAFLGEHDLDKDLLTIGRRPNNDVHIDNLAVSGSHAVVRTIGNDSFLEDLDSTNGTIVNGKPIKKHILQHGDVIELGKYQLKYVNEATVNAAAGGSPADFEKTMIIRPSAMKAAAPAPSPSIAAKLQSTTTVQETLKAAAPSPHEDAPVGHVQVLSGPSAGRELVLNKALTTLGKPGVQVAVITRRPHGYFVTHVEGTRHPVVNGQSVGAQAHELNDHDVIELAGVKMEFFLSKG
ncbi:MAG TPA: FHA domain-containing protein [Novimethylophilus sp.]|jgi:predicted component of type VI protein secretion system|uniref:FHA domain-containing protein n=1 Tax=Novimethylophilus sp. TaxID=2137426 RepID=UPI002F3E1F50